jgi:hypothetical protein
VLVISLLLQASLASADDCSQPSTSGCTIALNEPVTAVLANASDVHTWRLTLNSAARLHVALTNLPADYDVHVYTADGGLLGESTNEDTQDDVVDLPDAGAGIYIIYVNSARGDASDQPYTLLASGPPTTSRTIVLSDDFVDAHAGWLPTLQLAHGFTRYLDGEYQIVKTDDGTILPGVNIPGTLTDSTIAIDVRFVDPTPAVTLNIGCRRSGPNNGNQYYARVRPQARVAALVRSDGDTTNTTVLVPETPMSSLQRDSTTHVEFSCVGTGISLSLNGAPALAVQDATYASGVDWIGAGAGGGTSDARLSHLVVTRP